MTDYSMCCDAAAGGRLEDMRMSDAPHRDMCRYVESNPGHVY